MIYGVIKKWNEYAHLVTVATLFLRLFGQMGYYN